MKKAEIIERYGEDVYMKNLARDRARYKAHPEEYKAVIKKWQDEHREQVNACARAWRAANPGSVQIQNRELCRKGGKRYEKGLEYKRTGIPGEKSKIRIKHANQYRSFKRIIAPDSEIHHEWIGNTAEYRGMALVEANPHRYGIIDVIQILDGKITVLTEEEVRNGKKNEDEKEAETAVLLK